jgi:hypothetical protein
MSNEYDARNDEFAITPEEDRFLRAYFHRRAVRYLAALGLTAIVAVCATLVLTGGEEPANEPAPGAASTAELDEIRSDGEQLRGGLAELRRQVGSHATDASARVAALEQRLEVALERLERVEQQAGAAPAVPARAAALEQRLEIALKRLERVEQQAEAAPAVSARAAALEQRLEIVLKRLEQQAKTAPAAPAAVDSIADSDLNSVLERLYNLELRQEVQESKRESSEKDLLERMFQVESSREQLASARGEAERSMLERLSSLESRAFQLEKTVGASPPAAPAP